MTMCPNDHEADFESAKRARYERLSLLTLDMAEAAGRCARDHKGEIDGRAVSRAMAALSRAVWAHQIIERLRQGRSLSRADLMRLALGEAYEDRINPCTDNAKPDELIHCAYEDDEPSSPATPCYLENNIEEKNSDYWSCHFTGPPFMADEFITDELANEGVCATFKKGASAKITSLVGVVAPLDGLTDNLAPP